MAWQPAWQLLVAFNNAAQDNPTAITTVASPPGTLGAVNVWTDITADVRTNVDTNRGKQHELDHVQTGTLSLTLDNRAGNYDPWATSGPYAGLVLPGKPVRLQATTGGVTYPVYTGIADVWATQWTGEYYGTVALSCVDQFGYLANMYLNNPAFYVNLAAGDGAQHLYRLADPPASSTIVDAIGTAPGAAYNARSSVPGPLVTDMQPGMNMVPNGTSPTGIALGSTVLASSNWTIEIWAQHSAAPAARSYLWSNGFQGITGNPPGVAVWVGTDGRPGFSDPLPTDHTGGTSIADGLWHHLALTYTDSTTTFVLYVDGVSTITAAGVAGFTFPSANSLIGMATWATPACYGSVANFATYPTALTGARIVAHYQTAVFPAEPSGTRISRIATLMSIPAGTVDTGVSQIQPLTQAGLQGQQTLTYLQTVEDSELGLLYIAADGRLNFQSRGTIYTKSTSTQTFTDAPGGIPFELSPQIATDTQDVYELIQLQRNNGVTQTAGATNGPFGARTYSRTGLLNTSDAELQGMANFLVAQFATPVPRIRQIVIRPVSTAPNNTAMLALLGLEIGAVVTVTRTSTRRTAFSAVFNVDGINFHILPDTGDWNAELQLTPHVAPYVPWNLGTSTLGQTTALFF